MSAVRIASHLSTTATCAMRVHDAATSICIAAPAVAHTALPRDQPIPTAATAATSAAQLDSCMHCGAVGQLRYESSVVSRLCSACGMVQPRGSMGVRAAADDDGTFVNEAEWDEAAARRVLSGSFVGSEHSRIQLSASARSTYAGSSLSKLVERAATGDPMQRALLARQKAQKRVISLVQSLDLPRSGLSQMFMMLEQAALALSNDMQDDSQSRDNETESHDNTDQATTHPLSATAESAPSPRVPRFLGGRQGDLLVASVVHCWSRVVGHSGLSLVQVARVIHTDIHGLANMIQRLARACGWGLTVSSSPESFVDRCLSLSMSGCGSGSGLPGPEHIGARQEVLALLALARKHGLHEGRSPVALAGATVLIVLQARCAPPTAAATYTVDLMAKHLQIGTQALRARITEMRHALIQLIQETMPWLLDTTSPTPLRKRNRDGTSASTSSTRGLERTLDKHMSFILQQLPLLIQVELGQECGVHDAGAKSLTPNSSSSSPPSLDPPSPIRCASEQSTVSAASSACSPLSADVSVSPGASMVSISSPSLCVRDQSVEDPATWTNTPAPPGLGNSATSEKHKDTDEIHTDSTVLGEHDLTHEDEEQYLRSEEEIQQLLTVQQIASAQLNTRLTTKRSRDNHATMQPPTKRVRTIVA